MTKAEQTAYARILGLFARAIHTEIRRIKAEPVEDQPAAKAPRPKIGFDYEQVEFTGITEADLKSWKTIAPLVNIPRLIQHLAAFLRQHPDHVQSRYGAFLLRNIRREQDRLALRAGQEPPGPGNTRDAEAEAWARGKKGEM